MQNQTGQLKKQAVLSAVILFSPKFSPPNFISTSHEVIQDVTVNVQLAIITLRYSIYSYYPTLNIILPAGVQ